MGNACCLQEKEQLKEIVMTKSWKVGSGEGPMIICAPAYEVIGRELRKLYWDGTPSEPLVVWGNGPGTIPLLHAERLPCHEVVFIFDTVDQSMLFPQLAVLQALQGSWVYPGRSPPNNASSPEGSAKWCRADKVTVVIPWYRPAGQPNPLRCNVVERLRIKDEFGGPYLEVNYMEGLASLLAGCKPLSPPQGCKTSEMEFVFFSSSQEERIRSAFEDQLSQSSVRFVQFIPYFLPDLGAAEEENGITYVLFPSRGLYEKHWEASVKSRRDLELSQILWLDAGSICYLEQPTSSWEKAKCVKSFQTEDHVIIIEEALTNPNVIVGAARLARSLAPHGAGNVLSLSLFVPHFVADYDREVVSTTRTTMWKISRRCRMFTTNTIPLMADLLRQDQEIDVLSIAQFIADTV
mmetsp:Transcript_17011/g.36658  ORF Transcript_17011/g.36658 Transcript_17011/m.36658 type:complete len:407 (+) Transcript_17011:86-1306(+)